MPIQIKRRGALLLTTILAMMTALTLVYAAATIAQPPIQAPLDVRSGEVVRSFYAAINDTLRLGESSALARTVAPRFRVEQTPTMRIQDRNDLVAQIMDLRVAYPTLSVVVEDLITERDRVVARISLTGAEDLGLLGAPPSTTGQTIGASTELFRVQDDVIVEYVGLLTDLRVPRQIFAETLTADDNIELLAAAAQIMIAPDTHIAGLVTLGPSIFAISAGEVTFDVDGLSAIQSATTDGGISSPAEPLARNGVSVLRSGDQITIPRGVSYAMRSTGQITAVVTAMALLPPTWIGPPVSNSSAVTAIPLQSVMMFLADTPQERERVWPPGVDCQPLLQGVPLALPSGSVSLSLWQVTLPFGTVIRGHPPAGATQLMVASGSAFIETPAEEPADGITILNTGQAVPLDPKALTTARNIDDSPLELLILVVKPADEPPTRSGSTAP